MSIRETKDYILTAGNASDDKVLCYQIINREHGVIEVETSILPQALKYLMDLQTGLQAMLDIQEDSSKEVGLSSVVSIRKAH